MSKPEDKASDTGISELDAVLLSAYLDDELLPKEKAALEKRLRNEPNLKAELQALRASGDALRKADEIGAPAPAESASYLTTVRRRLKEEYPDEGLPVAPAVRPSPIRRMAILCAAGVAAMILLSLIVGLLQSLGFPSPSGWSARPLEGKVAIERRDRIVLALEEELLLVGDRLHLDHGEHAEIQGLANLSLRLSGPAVLTCGAKGLFLERGHLEVEGGAGTAWALRLRTPEGRLRPDGDGPYRFEVEVGSRGQD